MFTHPCGPYAIPHAMVLYACYGARIYLPLSICCKHRKPSGLVICPARVAYAAPFKESAKLSERRGEAARVTYTRRPYVGIDAGSGPFKPVGHDSP